MIKNIFMLMLLCLLHFSCNKMLDVKPVKSPFDKSDIFSSETTAASAITGIYANMYMNAANFASGSSKSITGLCGLSADELDVYNGDVLLQGFAQNELEKSSSYILELWKSMYSAIYAANNALSGLQSSTGIPEASKRQFRGEVLFIRAFTYLYLVDLFGEVPLMPGTDFIENSTLPRAPVDIVYEHILADLNEAYTLMKEEYVTEGRVRPNKWSAAALLARVYLYRGNWAEAEQYATIVLDQPIYTLPALTEVFKNTSSEAIWQLMPMGFLENTNEGKTFILQYGPFYDDSPYALTSSLITSFEPGDQRRTDWVGSYTESGVDYYYAYKYKVAYGGSASNPPVALTEYSMVLRMAEQYLIRAEARARQNNVEKAIEDLDMVRDRAGLPLIADTDPDISPDDLLLRIERERRVELFTEWGHRWLDLKRTGRAASLLGNKPGWSTEDQLYPIPLEEIIKNPNIGDQNPGY